MKTQKHLLYILILCLPLIFNTQAYCRNKVKKDVNLTNIIPQPSEIHKAKGKFKINAKTVIVIPNESPEYTLLTQILNSYLQPNISKPLIIKTGTISKNAIRFELHKTFAKANTEAYSLEVNRKGVTIKACGDAGLFYGLQSLLQIIDKRNIPSLIINDTPRFQYRGLHLDVSRHFFPKEDIIKLLDQMSFYKLNTFHWHLTDAGGWRIQIDKYPLLTKNSAFRTEEDWRKWWSNGSRLFVPEGTNGSYGGYYTKNDVREIVAFAQARHINIIPEIEMPGHSDEVFAAYPQLCCTGKAGSSGDFCIGNDSVFTFVEDVLTEIMELFPSEYIHIGGDEAGKKNWKTCPKCKARMETEGLTNVDELQSYMIRRVERFLNSKGRKLIGWDEILEGGLAPDATVMSWRGESGGIKAAKAGHDVVMTPSGYMYFDFYQADPKTQPYAIGGYTPIKRVYSYNPVSDSLTNEEAKYIIGVQANVWTEFMPNFKHVEYMVFPRLLALAEVAWTPQEKRDWQLFKQRMNSQIKRLQSENINTFPLSYEIEPAMNVDTTNREIQIYLDAEKYPAEIRYTTDGSTPTSKSQRYKKAINIKDSANIVAAIFEKGKLMGTPTSKKVDYHRGIGKTITFKNAFCSKYMAGGKNALIDGYRGGLTYLDGKWQGYLNDLDATVDMGERTTIHKISTRFMQLTGPGVYQPVQVEFMVSDDGQNYKSCGIIKNKVSPDNDKLAFQEYTVNGEWSARYIRIKAKKQRGFIFTDEVVIW